MQATINSVEGKDINVTFTFDDETTSTQTISVVPFATNGVDGDGNAVVIMNNPLDDLAAYLKKYADAFNAGVSAQAEVESALSEFEGQTITL